MNMHIVSSRLILSIFFASLSFNIFANDLYGKVIAISYGDTLTLLDKENKTHKIRLSGIDAPEKSQAYGQASKQALSNQVYGKSVNVDWNKRDRYGRIIGKVIRGSQDVNLEQIKLGMAWHYKKYENEQEIEDRSLYSHAEYLAQRNRRGLWTEHDPTAPWDFRKAKRN